MSAVLSPCRRYRYRLDRNVDMFGGITLGFCLHNPSTADGIADDPTVRRCIGFATALDARRLVVVNAWAGRATDPSELWRLDDPIGPENDESIAEVADEVAASGGFMIAGWGVPKPPAALAAATAAHLAAVAALIAEQTCEIRALGVNRDGSPTHPLYVPGHVRPVRWSPPPLHRQAAE